MCTPASRATSFNVVRVGTVREGIRCSASLLDPP
jgi:hypothetical protein